MKYVAICSVYYILLNNPLISRQVDFSRLPWLFAPERAQSCALHLIRRCALYTKFVWQKPGTRSLNGGIWGNFIKYMLPPKVLKHEINGPIKKCHSGAFQQKIRSPWISHIAHVVMVWYSPFFKESRTGMMVIIRCDPIQYSPHWLNKGGPPLFPRPAAPLNLKKKEEMTPKLFYPPLNASKWLRSVCHKNASSVHKTSIVEHF
jgi:hypothetical protein